MAPPDPPKLSESRDVNTSQRRKSEVQVAPQMQVVGFHVEGISPSPASAAALLLATLPPSSAGSPTPVIIPPTFQRDSASRENTHSRNSVEINRAAASLQAASHNTIPQDTSAAAVTALLHAAAAAASPSSRPQPIQHPHKAEAAHQGLTIVNADSSASLESPPSTQTSSQPSMLMGSLPELRPLTSAAAGPSFTGPSLPPQLPDRHAHGASSAAAGAAAGSRLRKSSADGDSVQRGGGAGGGSAAGVQVPAAGPPIEGAAPVGGSGKAQKDMTKAERRALQEAQRSAKAAAKGVAPAEQTKKAGGVGGAGAAAPGVPGARDGGRGDTAGKAGRDGRPPVGQPQGTSSTSGTGQRTTVVNAAYGSSPFAASSMRPMDTSDAAQRSAGAATNPHPAKDVQAKASTSLNSAGLFAHLQQHKVITVSSLLNNPAARTVHSAVLQLGLRYADGSVTGANARCLAMLNAMCQVIQDYKTPEGKTLCRDLLVHINHTINFLVVCRPLSVSMGNAIKWLKLRIARIKPDEPDAEAKEYLLGEIQDFVDSRITRADTMLVSYAVQKMESGDIILTYAYSHVVYQALLEAATSGKRFTVVVVDSRPESEGRHMLRKLLAAGIPCTYVYINALSYIMREVTKVFLGATTVLPNGTVISRAGAAAVAMMAAAHFKPVMICCESYKFSERVQLDSITHNELGDPQELVKVGPNAKPSEALQGWSSHPRLKLLNLKYDAMPSEYVTMIVTEFGMIPPTSVPVLLREFRQLELAQGEAGFKE